MSASLFSSCLAVILLHRFVGLLAAGSMGWALVLVFGVGAGLSRGYSAGARQAQETAKVQRRAQHRLVRLDGRGLCNSSGNGGGASSSESKYSPNIPEPRPTPTPHLDPSSDRDETPVCGVFCFVFLGFWVADRDGKHAAYSRMRRDKIMRRDHKTAP